MTAERGVVYGTKRIGPKTDPCGTPQDTDAGTDVYIHACEQRPIGLYQKYMMKTNRGLYQKGRNGAAICEGECHDR